MVQEIMILWLPESMNAMKLEELLLERLHIPQIDVQIVRVKKGKGKIKLKKKLKKEVMKLVGKYAKFHESLIDPRQLSHRYGFYNYFTNY